jgi:hypothetical protein
LDSINVGLVSLQLDSKLLNKNASWYIFWYIYIPILRWWNLLQIFQWVRCGYFSIYFWKFTYRLWHLFANKFHFSLSWINTSRNSMVRGWNPAGGARSSQWYNCSWSSHIRKTRPIIVFHIIDILEHIQSRIHTSVPISCHNFSLGPFLVWKLFSKLVLAFLRTTTN